MNTNEAFAEVNKDLALKKSNGDNILDEKVTKLLNILKDEFKLYKYILTVAINKKNIIIKGNIKELEETLKIEKEFIVNIKKMEEFRENLVSDLAKNLGLYDDKLNINTILPKLKTVAKVNEIKECQEEIKKVINDLKNINEINAKLIKNSLEYVDFSLNIITNVGEINNNYGSKGNVGEAKKKTYFDKKL